MNVSRVKALQGRVMHGDVGGGPQKPTGLWRGQPPEMEKSTHIAGFQTRREAHSSRRPRQRGGESGDRHLMRVVALGRDRLLAKKDARNFFLETSPVSRGP